MDTEIENLIVKLGILSKLPENTKLYTTSPEQIGIENNTLYQGVSRWFRGESREKTLEVLRSLANTTISVSDNLIEKLHPENNKISPVPEVEKAKALNLLHNLVSSIGPAIVGLNNLKTTYNTDASITAKLDVVIRKLNTQIKKISYHVSGNQDIPKP